MCIRDREYAYEKVPRELDPFDGDTFEGVLKIPFVGKVKLKDGRRLA